MSAFLLLYRETESHDNSRVCLLEQLTVAVPPHCRPAYFSITLLQVLLLERDIDGVYLDLPSRGSSSSFVAPVIPQSVDDTDSGLVREGDGWRWRWTGNDSVRQSNGRNVVGV